MPAQQSARPWNAIVTTATGARAAPSELLASRRTVEQHCTATRNALNAPVPQVDLGLDTRLALADKQVAEISTWRARRTEAGHSHREIKRVLKRYLARDRFGRRWGNGESGARVRPRAPNMALACGFVPRTRAMEGPKQPNSSFIHLFQETAGPFEAAELRRQPLQRGLILWNWQARMSLDSAVPRAPEP